MTNKYDEREYLDALVTIEIAARLAELDRRPVNSAIRACWTSIRCRVANDLNRNIFDGVAKQFMPHGALCMLRRQLDATLSA